MCAWEIHINVKGQSHPKIDGDMFLFIYFWQSKITGVVSGESDQRETRKW